MSTPKRIQLSRKAGWRKPEGAIVVSRPNWWGNPFTVGKLVRDPGGDSSPAFPYAGNLGEGEYEGLDLMRRTYPYAIRKVRDRADAVELFKAYIAFENIDWSPADIRLALGGRDLCCWCPLDQPCHASVLLYIANPGLAELVSRTAEALLVA